MLIKKCFKCGTTEGHFVEHHISYNPEEKAWCCRSCHRILHLRLRKLGKCRFTPDELRKKGTALYRKNYVKRISFYIPLEQNVRFHESISYNLKTEMVIYTSTFSRVNRIEDKGSKKVYRGQNIRTLNFATKYDEISLTEMISYNKKTGSVYYTSGFKGNIYFINKVD